MTFLVRSTWLLCMMTPNYLKYCSVLYYKPRIKLCKNNGNYFFARFEFLIVNINRTEELKKRKQKHGIFVLLRIVSQA